MQSTSTRRGGAGRSGESLIALQVGAHGGLVHLAALVLTHLRAAPRAPERLEEPRRLLPLALELEQAGDGGAHDPVAQVPPPARDQHRIDGRVGLVGLPGQRWGMARTQPSWLVDGASRLALRLGISPMVVGLTIVGFGTSAPEMVVSALAASQGNPGIALGNAYGSNITNIALILGVTALISPIAVHSQVLRKELPILTVVTALAAWQLWDGEITRLDAIVLLAVFGGLSDFLPRGEIAYPKIGPVALILFVLVVSGVVLRHRFLDVDRFLVQAAAMIAASSTSGSCSPWSSSRRRDARSSSRNEV